MPHLSQHFPIDLPLERAVGLEPTLFHSSAWKADAIAAMRCPRNLERLAGIEPASQEWRS